MDGHGVVSSIMDQVLAVQQKKFLILPRNVVMGNPPFVLYERRLK